MRQPTFKFVGRCGDHPQRHIRVLKTTELGALSAKVSSMIRLNPFRRYVRWNQILLSLQVRNPKAVNHIVRGAADHHGTADWNVQLIRGYSDSTRVVIRIPNIPPPLIASDLNDHTVPSIKPPRGRFSR